MEWHKRWQHRWTCPACGSSGWYTVGQTFNPFMGHDTPNGRACKKQIVDWKSAYGPVEDAP